MSIDISLETEARLKAKAQEQGLSIDALLERLLSDGSDQPARPAGEASKLPAWNLGVRGSLHRSEIYDDVE